jgi:TetR/AcrR family tetracycline transcriptional repressor
MIAAARRLGPDGISLPALATELQVGRTSLYWHVRDRDEIGEAVLATIIEEGETQRWEPDPDRSWDEVMASYARASRAGLIAAGGWIRYATPRLVLGRSQLRAMDGLVGRLRACGFPIEEATRAYTYLFQVVLASIGSGDAPVTQMHQALSAELGSGDGAELRSLREVVKIAAATRPDQQFEYDLDCTLRGIANRAGISLGTRPDGPPKPARRRSKTFS